MLVTVVYTLRLFVVGGEHIASVGAHLCTSLKNITDIHLLHGPIVVAMATSTLVDITKHGSTWYIGMAHVPRHRFHIFQSELSLFTTTK